MGAGEGDSQSVELLAQRRQCGRAMRRGLRGDGHAEFALGYFQAGRKLPRGLKQSAAFLIGPGIAVLEHPY